MSAVTALRAEPGIDPAIKQKLEARVKNVMFDVLFSSVQLGEKYEVFIKPGLNTAAWSYMPPHRIYVGTGLLDNAKTALQGKFLQDGSLDYYVDSYIHHELGHFKHTERDLKKVNAQLGRRNIPFSLFNLFEDARIEHLWRKDLGRLFRWADFEEVSNEDHLVPHGLFFRLIQSEGNLEAVMAAGQSVSGFNESLLTKVHAYYQEVLACPQSMLILPVMERWLKEFPEAVPPDSGMGGSGNASSPASATGLELSLALQIEGAAGSFHADASSLNGGSRKGAKTGGLVASGQVLHEVPSAGEGVLLSKYAEEVDHARATRLANRLSKAFQDRAHLVSTETPQKRMSVKHYSLGRKYFRKEARVGLAKAKVSLIIDCSGSMQGSPIDEGRVFASTLNRLAIDGRIEGELVLSAITGGEHVYQVFQLPVKDSVIERIQAFGGGEGLEPTMQAQLASLKKSDWVLVYTDANITDTPIRKERFHRQGVHTHGVYIGSSEVAPLLGTHFDKALIRESVENLVDALVTSLPKAAK